MTNEEKQDGKKEGYIMTKKINIEIEIYDETSTEDVERIISAVLDDNGIDCTYNVENINENE